MVNNGYMEYPMGNYDMWVLNDEGNLAKRLGGHANYETHKNRGINLLKSNLNANYWNKRVAFAIAGAAILTLGAQLYQIYKAPYIPYKEQQKALESIKSSIDSIQTYHKNIYNALKAISDSL